MTDWFWHHFEWKDEKIPYEVKKTQVYIAVHKALMKSDDQIVEYHLLLKKIPDWSQLDVESLSSKFIDRLLIIKAEIEEEIEFPDFLTLYRRIQKKTGAFEIFKAITLDEGINLANLVRSRKEFEKKIRSVCETKYKLIKKRVRTGIIRSIVYIFFTKILFALVFEIPVEIFLYKDVRYFSLTMNIFIPPFMMFLAGLSIKEPGKNNTDLIVEQLKGLVYENKEGRKVSFSTGKITESQKLLFFFSIFYALVILLVFLMIIYLLTLLKFTPFAIVIFFSFMSLVLLFSSRVKFNASYLNVEAEREGFISHLLSYLTLPFLKLGLYLSEAFSRINFLTIIFDFLIEIPFKNIVSVFEEWVSFIREKKEEVIKMPE